MEIDKFIMPLIIQSKVVPIIQYVYDASFASYIYPVFINQKSLYYKISDKTYIYLKHLNTIYIQPLRISFEHIASLDFLKRPRNYF